MTCPAVKDFALEYELIVNPVYPMPGLEDLLSGMQNPEDADGDHLQRSVLHR